MQTSETYVEARQPDVEAAMKALMLSIEALSVAVEKLSSELTPVLRCPYPQRGTSETKSLPGECPLSIEIYQANTAITVAGAVLHDIIDALEI